MEGNKKLQIIDTHTQLDDKQDRDLGVASKTQCFDSIGVHKTKFKSTTTTGNESNGIAETIKDGKESRENTIEQEAHNTIVDTHSS